MASDRVLVGRTMLDLASVTSCHWEDERLFVYLDGGRFLQFKGDEATALYAVLIRNVHDVVEWSDLVK